MPEISSAARLYGIVGDPVDVVRSPGFYNAEFARLGLDAVFVPLAVAAADLAVAWRGLTSIRNLDGLLVTMPHKRAVVPLLDTLAPTARLTDTVNIARRLPDGRWEGAMFDGEGMLQALRAAGHDPEGRTVLLVGAGGVGRAIGFALAQAGALALDISDLDADRAGSLATELAGAFQACTTRAVAPVPGPHALVVNATPMGMRPNDPLPLDAEHLAAGTVVADVIPNPEVTPLLTAARERGCPIVTGRDLFNGQVALAMAFLGLAPPG
jgi:shikimate dehydrogenase